MGINHWKTTRRGKIKPARMPTPERLAWAAEILIGLAFALVLILNF